MLTSPTFKVLKVKTQNWTISCHLWFHGLHCTCQVFQDGHNNCKLQNKVIKIENLPSKRLYHVLVTLALMNFELTRSWQVKKYRSSSPRTGCFLFDHFNVFFFFTYSIQFNFEFIFQCKRSFVSLHRRVLTSFSKWKVMKTNLSEGTLTKSRNLSKRRTLKMSR